MKKNFLISTGGSGGHVIPATILYDHLAEKTNVIISTDNIFFLPFNLISILFLTLKSFFFLKKENVERIFSTGGYMSLPIIVAARFLKLKIYLIEPNQIIGRANRFFLNSCEKIFCYTKQIKDFPENLKSKVININPLVKKHIYELKSSRNFEDKFTLLIVGGSQGANIFDDNLKKIIVNISKKKPIRIIQQTNEKNIYSLNDYYEKNNIENEIFSFEKNLANYIQQSDLCISRAGASTLAELSIMNVPFIAVPLPTSQDNHQFENAYFYKKNDCCWLVEQKDFEKKIEEILNEILDDKSNYLKKKENLKKLNYQNTWINVNQKILKVINEN